MLAGEYVDSSWRPKLVDAFEQFRAECANAAKAFKQGERTKHYSEFVQPLSGSGSDTAETIRRRHQFLLQEIINIVQPRPRDPQRMFGQIEREIMWYRQSGRCAHPECLKPTVLTEMHAHHICEHSKGGTTTLENGVLVCRTCHQNRRDMRSLEEHFRNLITSTTDSELFDQDSAVLGDLKLRIEINWPALAKGDSPEVIHRPTDTDGIVIFCARLVDVFGDEAITWMSDRPITRFPISKTPEQSFKNPVSGKLYSYREIGKTGYFVCTHSSQPEKLRRLQNWVSELPEPIDEAITVSLVSRSGG